MKTRWKVALALSVVGLVAVAGLMMPDAAAVPGLQAVVDIEATREALYAGCPGWPNCTTLEPLPTPTCLPTPACAPTVVRPTYPPQPTFGPNPPPISPEPVNTNTPTPTSEGSPMPTPTNTSEASPVPTPTPELAWVRAFPGAEGFGANSVGGRGGRVIEVTNLNESGAGSLRACINASGPRICVFRTGGTIVLQSGLRITNPYITIAGQTAPGGGITLRNHPSNTSSALTISTHDVVIRYIRSRPGPSTQRTSNLDAIQILFDSAYNVIIDHCSASWATDETVSTWYAPHDITIQWSIISEGLNCSTHAEGCHSKGLLLGSGGSRNMSIHHNLFAHNVERNPLVKISGLIDIVNNVVYNPRWSALDVSDEYARAFANYVGNYFKRGPGGTSDYSVSTADVGGNGFEIFVRGNIGPARPSDGLDESLAVKPRSRGWLVETRHGAPFVATTTAFEAYDQVLAGAGATIGLDSQGNSFWRRDSVDDRIVDDVRNGTGGIIDDPGAVGGWPELAAGTAPADADHDGMPDQWEDLHGLNRNDPSDGPADADGDGYTNLEEYLNGTDPGG